MDNSVKKVRKIGQTIEEIKKESGVEQVSLGNGDNLFKAKKEPEVEANDEQNDGDNQIFPDGPTTNQVEGWKSLYGQIYLTEFDEDTTYIWRILTRKEYKGIMKIDQADQYYREERICEKCVLWPEKYSFLSMGSGKAGVPSFIAEQVMDKSGFVAKTGAVKL